MLACALPAAFVSTPLAHRGLHDAALGVVENSAAAVTAAVAAGYGVEIDVRLSRDGQAVVFHDAALDRMTGLSGPLAECDSAELGATRLLGSTETVPMLADILQRVGDRAPLLIELKDPTGALSDSDGRLEAAVVAVLAGHRGPVAAMSFNPAIAGKLRRLSPTLAVGLATDAFRAEDWPGVANDRLTRLRRIDLDAAGACFVSHDHRDLDNPRVAELRAAGRPILTWTIRSPEEEAAARRVADNITFEGYLPQNPPQASHAARNVG